MNILVTGSGGLIGSEVTDYFLQQGNTVVGIDNNSRRAFFGPQGDIMWNLRRFDNTSYKHYQCDIRMASDVNSVFAKEGPFDAIIHCAAQPSHDLAAKIPVLDFETNAVGTMHLLEAMRTTSPKAIFIFTSTNKVYGDGPNHVPIIELETRYNADPIDESFPVDQCTHSLFGVSKLAADVMVQEYGRYFGFKTCVLRGGCLTGPNHSGVQLHGFLSYLVKCVVTGTPYTIFGYKGKQVRDNIHSHDVATVMQNIIADPPTPGDVFNLGGGKENSVSILEAIDKISKLAGKTLSYTYDPKARIGDHICYTTDLTKLRTRYPNWQIEYPIQRTLEEMVRAEQSRSI